MPLILRIDVDKPYGNHTFARKVASKFFEETAFPSPKTGYLSHLCDFLDIIQVYQIPAIFYFRICTLPSKEITKKILEQNHKIGWHLENSKNYESFKQELKLFKILV